jgi:hypothetical protein
MSIGTGTKDDPWVLTTPSGGSGFTVHRDEAVAPPAFVVQVGKTELRYHLRCIDDLYAMLVKRGDWVPLGNADEQKPAPEGSVEAWGRFADYVPPVLEWLGLAEVEHNAGNNRMRAASQ